MADVKHTATPSFIRGWTAPFQVTMDGIKDARGCWIANAANNKLAHELVELMNFAASSQAEIARLREALLEHVTDNLHNAYAVGITQDGKWMDGGMSDGEWLRRELGLGPGWHDAQQIRDAIPALADKIVARAALQGSRDPVQEPSP